MIRALAPLLVAAMGASLVGVAQPEVDRTRAPRAIDEALVFVPDGQTLRIAATGLEEPIADLLWVRAVLIFGERYDETGDEVWTRWLRAMILAVDDLDPDWRTPHFWGGLMLRVSGDLEGSDEVFRRGERSHTDDSFFPFALAINAWMYHEDHDAAAEHAERAAHKPKAPGWYGAAAAAFRSQAGDRRAAIRFLEESRDATTNDALRRDSERQLRRLYHDEMVSSWEAPCRAWYAEKGERLARPEDLSLLGFELPPNPRGDAWIVGSDGVVRSRAAEAERRRRLLQEEFEFLR